MISQGDLFVRPDGRPIVFLMSPAVRERIQVMSVVMVMVVVIVFMVNQSN